MTDDEMVGFYADPVDGDGNVIGYLRVFNVRSGGKPVQMVKIPHDEMALDPEMTIDVDLTDDEETHGEC